MGKIYLVYVLFCISPRIWNGLRTYTEVPLYIKINFLHHVHVKCLKLSTIFSKSTGTTLLWRVFRESIKTSAKCLC
jgi:hypothetical protein